VTYEQTNERSADGKEIWLRHVRKATGLYDVAIVTHPAYEQTSVVTREFGDEIMRQIDEQIEAHKREAGNDDAQKQREAEEQAKREQEEREAKEREERELQEQEQRFRQQQAMRLRYKAQRLNDEIIESL
jgi:hypothetical protein